VYCSLYSSETQGLLKLGSWWSWLDETERSKCSFELYGPIRVPQTKGCHKHVLGRMWARFLYGPALFRLSVMTNSTDEGIYVDVRRWWSSRKKINSYMNIMRPRTMATKRCCWHQQSVCLVRGHEGAPAAAESKRRWHLVGFPSHTGWIDTKLGTQPGSQHTQSVGISAQAGAGHATACICTQNEKAFNVVFY
jgi:hypothetical protein